MKVLLVFSLPSPPLPSPTPAPAPISLPIPPPFLSLRKILSHSPARLKEFHELLPREPVLVTHSGPQHFKLLHKARHASRQCQRPGECRSCAVL